jgi:hypothetical protein
MTSWIGIWKKNLYKIYIVLISAALFFLIIIAGASNTYANNDVDNIKKLPVGDIHIAELNADIANYRMFTTLSVMTIMLWLIMAFIVFISYMMFVKINVSNPDPA